MKRTAALLCVLALAASCRFEDTREDRCDAAGKCDDGFECIQGFCIRDEDDDPPPTAGKDAAVSGGGTGGAGGRTGSMMNPMTMNDGGPRNDAGPAGQGGASGAGGSGPRPCRDGETRKCMLPGSSAERCRGGSQRCDDGIFGACIAELAPSAEECNGVDDDCDGRTDEFTSAICYPTGESGCVVEAGRAPKCDGICTLGTRECVDGELGECTGATTPEDEVCTTSGAASDENCDGSSDEVCACTPGEMRACYTGALGTLGVGTCKAGTQVCTNGSLGACTGAIGPVAETCLNENSDDDCDGMPDDIVSRNAPCSVESNMGVCRNGTFQCQGSRAELTCVTPVTGPETCNSLDDDCDGRVDETVNLQTDNANCGACGTTCTTGQACCGGVCTNTQSDSLNCGGCGPAAACASGSSCCNGQCVDTTQDSMNCGACGNPCGVNEACCGSACVNTQTDRLHCGTCTTTCTTGMQPGCCGGTCVDLVSREHCGNCETKCGQLTGELLCTCEMTSTGAMCMAPAAGVCL